MSISFPVVFFLKATRLVKAFSLFLFATYRLVVVSELIVKGLKDRDEVDLASSVSDIIS